MYVFFTWWISLFKLPRLSKRQLPMAKPSTFKFESAAYNKVLVILSFTMLLELRTQEGEREVVGEWTVVVYGWDGWDRWKRVQQQGNINNQCVKKQSHDDSNTVRTFV
jgi:competence CoiA-like predicted nuclease